MLRCSRAVLFDKGKFMFCPRLSTSFTLISLLWVEQGRFKRTEGKGEAADFRKTANRKIIHQELPTESSESFSCGNASDNQNRNKLSVSNGLNLRPAFSANLRSMFVLHIAQILNRSNDQLNSASNISKIPLHC